MNDSHKENYEQIVSPDIFPLRSKMQVILDVFRASIEGFKFGPN